MNATLYLNGQRMDSPDNMSITLTYRSAAFVSVDKINNSYSNTITLPRTAHNDAVLGAIVYPSTKSDKPYAYIPASIEIGGIMVVPSAIAYITEVTSESVKVAVVWDSVSQLAALAGDGRQLNELPYEFSDNVLWSKERASTLPVADWGFSSDDPDVAQHPSMKVTDVLQRILDVYGLPSPPEEDVQFMKDWHIPLVNRIDPILTEFEPLTENNVSSWYGAVCSYVRQAVNTATSEGYKTKFPVWLARLGKNGGIAPDTPLPDIDIPTLPIRPNPIVPFADDEIEDTDTPILDASGRPADTNADPDYVSREIRGIVSTAASSKGHLQYLAPKYPNIEFICSGDLTFPLANANTATDAFMLANVKLKLVLLYRYKLVTEDYHEEELLSISADSITQDGVRFKFTEVKSDPIPTTLLGEKDIYKEVNTRIEWRLEYEAPTMNAVKFKVGNAGKPTDFSEPALTIAARQKVTHLDTPYFLIPNLPPITVINFVKSLAQMGGRFITIDDVLNKDSRPMKRGLKLRFRSYEEYEERKGEAIDLSNYVIGDGTLTFKIGDWGQRNTFTYKEGKFGEKTNFVDFFLSNESLKAENKAVELPYSTADGNARGVIRIPVYKYEEGETEAEYDGGDEAYIATLGYDGKTMIPLVWRKLISSYERLFDSLRNVKVIKLQMRMPLAMLQNIDLYCPVYIKQYGSYFAIIEIKTRGNNIVDMELLKL